MNVTVTIELPASRLSELQNFLESKPAPEKPKAEPATAEKRKAAPEPKAEPQMSGIAATTGQAPAPTAEPMPAEEAPEPEIPVTKTMLRTRGLELSRANKKAELEAVFRQFGAEKLRDLKEEDYAAVYKLLGEL